MGVSWLTKTIVYSSTAVACCIAIMQYYRKKQEKNSKMKHINLIEIHLIISWSMRPLEGNYIVKHIMEQK